LKKNNISVIWRVGRLPKLQMTSIMTNLQNAKLC